MTIIFSELMKDDQIKRAVLVKFGFGNVNKSKVTKWVKEEFPTQYAEIKKNIPSKKVVEFSSNETEMTTKEERDAFLDKVMGKLDEMQERKRVSVYEDEFEKHINSRELLEAENDLNEYINHQGCLEVENEGLTELIYDFIQENGLSEKFYNFLVKNKENYSCDIDFLMLDYNK